MTRAALVAWFALLAVGTSCDRPRVPTDLPIQPSLDFELRQLLNFAYGVVPIGPVPPQSQALVDLGQALFFDKILSGNRDISCATCHHPSTHGADGLSLAIGTGGTGLGPSRTLGPGHQFVPRNSPTLLNQGLRGQYLFWDGRLEGFAAGPFRMPPGVTLPAGLPNILAAQAMLPVLNRREMRGEPGDLDVFGSPNELAQLSDAQYAEVWAAIMQRILAIPEYMARFSAAFPTQGNPSFFDFKYAAAAIAAFITQSFTRASTPFDRYLTRNDAALTLAQKRGALLFFGPLNRPRCVSCHNGPLLGGQSFANVGVPQIGPGTGSAAPLDIGRGDVLLSGQPPQSNRFYRFAFRPPPLRNVELTAPYMHNGAYPTLEAVVRHYNNVPLAMRNYDVTQLAPALRGMVHNDNTTINDIALNLNHHFQAPLGLSDAELSDLVAFLKSLTDPSARNLSALVPARVPSGLPLEN